MQTKRDYLVGLGLAKPGRGKFSNAGREAIAKAEAAGTKFSDQNIVKSGPKITKAPKATKNSGDDVQSEGDGHYLFPDEYRFPEAEYRAVAIVDGKKKVYGMREACNTCRVSLVNHVCDNPSILGNITVKIERK